MENDLKYKKLVYNYPYLQKVVKEHDKYEICTTMSMDGKIIYGIKREEHIYYLNSRYSVEHECDRILKICKVKGNPFAVFVIYGLGDGWLIRKIREKYPDNYIYVHEPSVNIFHKFMETEEDIDFIIDEHIVITIGEQTKGARIEILHEIVDINNFYITEIICTPQYRNFMLDDYLIFLNDFYARVEQIIMQKNTDIAFNSEHINNFWCNIIDVLNQYGVKSLIDILKEKNEGRYPAFIVSAGPSLDNNIEQLKKINGRGIIMAVDTAIKPLLKKGIKPDIVASVDPHKPLELFQCDGAQELPMLVDINYNSKIREFHKGKRFYAWSGEPFVKEFLEKLDVDLGIVESGGSVACNLFSLAIFAGFKTIILVGQDLAYPNKRGHSASSYNNEKSINTDNGKYFLVDDIYGNPIYTEGNMNAYRKWFESTIARCTLERVIDATEGGAKINGTEIMTLDNAITECCANLSSISWNNIINDCENLIDTKQKKKAIELIHNMPAEVDELEKTVKDGLELVKKINDEKDNNAYSTKEYICQIMEINSMLKDSLEAKLVGMYNAQVGYAVSMAAYRVNENVDKDIEDITKLCKMTFEGYLNAIELFRKDYDSNIKL